MEWRRGGVEEKNEEVRKMRKKSLAGRPKPRRKCERKATRSSSCSAGEISVSGGTRALTKAALGIRRVSWRKAM